MRQRSSPLAAEVVLASQHDYGVPGAVQARHKAYAKGLVAEGIGVRLLALGHQSGDFGVADVQTILLNSRGSRLDRVRAIRRAADFLITERPQAVIFGMGIVPEVMWPLLTVARSQPTIALHEISEHPAVSVQASSAPWQRLRTYRQVCLPMFDGLVPITHALSDLLVPFAEAAVVSAVLPPLVDEAVCARPGVGRVRGRIGYAGSLSLAKDGVDRLVQAVHIVRERPQCQDATLQIYGDGADRPDLQRLITAYGLSSAITLHGTVDQRSLPDLYRECSVLALARPDSVQARFGWPTKVAEYLASGTPTAVTAVGEIPHYLKDGQSAYLSASSDPRTMADTLERALTDPRRDEVAQAGRDVALTQFSPARGARIILEVIEECLARR